MIVSSGWTAGVTVCTNASDNCLKGIVSDGLSECIMLVLKWQCTYNAKIHGNRTRCIDL